MFSNVFQCYLLSFSLSLSLSLSHYLTLSHSHTLSISHWITLDMLNNFCFHLYAQKSLSIEKWQRVFLTSMVFSWEQALWLVDSQVRVMVSKTVSKKPIDVYIHKQRHLSIDMKTKIVQHVPRINISIWHKTCDMRHVTCDIIINTHFWAKTSKQKLFSMSQEST